MSRRGNIFRRKLGLVGWVGLVSGLGCAPASPPAELGPAVTPQGTPVLLGTTPRYFFHLHVALPDSSYVAILAIVPRERVARLYPLTGQASPRFPPGVHEIPARRPPPSAAFDRWRQFDRVVSVVFPGGPGGSVSIADLSYTPSPRDVPWVALLPTPSPIFAGPPSGRPHMYVLTSRSLLRAADLDRLLDEVDWTTTPDSVMAALARRLGWQGGPQPWGGTRQR